MPANVTPEYEKAEQRYREATTDAERVAALQDMLATIPKHKGTETAFDQVEATFAALSARGLSLRTVPRNVLSFLEPSVRPGLIIANKADLANADTLPALRELYAPGLEVMAVSAQTGEGLDEWFHRLWELLAIIRVYAKQPAKPPDLNKPFVLPAGSTVADLARLIHRDLLETMKFARVWGHGRFDGQQVHRTEPLQDRDIVEIHE